MTTEKAIQRNPAHTIEVARQPQETSRWTYRPDADILRSETEYTIVLDVPGVRPDAVDLSVEDRVLTVHARPQQRQPENVRWLRTEYGVGDYFRRFQFDESVDAERISAECDGGVLRIHLPIAESARPRRITISGAK